MAKNDKYIQRYQELIRVMRGLSRHERKHHFDMANWGVETDCGTVCCAAGHAGQDAWFRRRGFSFHSQGNTLFFGGEISWGAVGLFFDGEPVSYYSNHPVFKQPNSVGEVIRAAQKRIRELKAIP